MKLTQLTIIAATCLLANLFCVGCSSSSAPPESLTAEQLPGAMQQAFAKAKPDLKELANQAVAFVQNKNYSQAYAGLQDLSTRSGLTKNQASVISRALLTVNGLLQSAKSTGDPQAAQLLKQIHDSK